MDSRAKVSSFRQDIDAISNRSDAVIAVASVCGFYIHLPLALYTAAKQWVLWCNANLYTRLISSGSSAVVGFVRSYGKILAEEHITLNAVCPNKVRTNISTPASYDRAEKAGVLVPMEKLLEAFELLLSKEGEYASMSGECLEVAPKLGIRVVPKMEFVNEESRISADMT